MELNYKYKTKIKGLVVSLVLLCFMFINYGVLKGQTNIDWLALNDVKFEKVTNEAFATSYDVATFGEWVKSLDGEEVILSGYLIPMDAMGTTYALSRNPNSSCFFCGGAGPETVLRLWLIGSAMKRYKTDEYLAFKGILRLSENNERSFIYELWEAQLANF